MPRLQSPPTYESLHSSSTSANVFLRVLQMSVTEKQTVTPTITSKLNNKNIAPSDTLGSDHNKTLVGEIIQELRSEARHRSLFNKASNAGEDDEEVDLAIRRLIYNVHTIRKKRFNRATSSPSRTKQEDKTKERRPTPEVGPEQEAATSSGPAPGVMPGQSLPVPMSRRLIIVHIDDDDSPRLFRMSDAISGEPGAASDQKTPDLSVFKANVEKRFAPRIIDWSEAQIEVRGIFVSCDHQVVFETVCDITEEHQNLTLRRIRFSATSDTPKPNESATDKEKNTNQNSATDVTTVGSSQPETPPPIDNVSDTNQDSATDAPTVGSSKLKTPPPINNVSDTKQDSATDAPTVGSLKLKTPPPIDNVSDTNQNSATDPPRAKEKGHVESTQKPQPAASNGRDSEANKDKLPKNDKKRKHASTDSDVQYQTSRPVLAEAKKRKVQPGNTGHSSSQKSQTQAHNSGAKEQSDKGDDNEEAGIENRGDSYKIKPTHLPSWEESGQDISIGVVVPSHCYDEDEPHPADPEVSNNTISDEDQDQLNDKTIIPSIEGDPDLKEQEERQRKLKKAKQELQRALEQMDEELLQKAYRFFKHDKTRKSIKVEDRIQQAGAKRAYQQHQAYAIFWILWTERFGTKGQVDEALGGGILGDEPGFGKSATMAGVFLSEAWLNKAWAEVNHARKNNKFNLHLAKGTLRSPQPPGAACPSGEPYGICCPCVDANPSAQMDPKIGAGLLMVPPNLAINSLRELMLQIDTRNTCFKMRFLYQATPPAGQRNQHINVGPENQEIKIRDLAASSADVNYLQTNALSPDLAQWVIICSRESWDKYIRETKLDTIRYSRFFRDEFHQEPGVDTNWIKNLKSLNNKHRSAWGRPFGWLASGTPFEKGPESLVGAMSLLMWWYVWEKDVFWSKYTPDKLHELQSQLKAYINDDAAAEEMDDDIDNNTVPNDQKVREWNTLLTNLMIQRGRGCMWFNKPIMPLPRLRYREIEVENSEMMNIVAMQAQHSMSREEAAKIGAAKDITRSAIYNLCRATATFPKLSMQKYRAWPILDRKGKTKTVNLTIVKGLNTAGLFKKDNIMDPAKNPFLADIENLAVFGPKLTHIRTIIDQIGVDYQDAPGQAILFTYSNLTAMLLYLWFKKNGYLIDFLHAQLSSTERDSIVHQFQTGKIHFVVTTAKVGGTGITLTRAKSVIMVEALSDAGLWSQCQARAHRFGNLNWMGITVFEIYNVSSAAEMQAKRRREGKLQLAAAQAATMVKQIQEGGKVIGDAEILDMAASNAEDGM